MTTETKTEDTKTPTQPAPDSPEYKEMMAAKFEGRDPNAQVPAKPAEGVDKFYDAKTGTYNWEAHTKELLFNANGRQKPDAKPEDGKPPASEPAKPDASAAPAFDWNALGEKAVKTGKLDDADYAAFDKIGFPREIVDQHISMLKASAESAVNQQLAYIGGGDAAKGEAEWKVLNEWAAKSLSPQEQVTFNGLLQGPGWQAAIDTMKTRMKAGQATGREGVLVLPGQGSLTHAPAGYTSRKQQIKDMQDPRYRSDPAFQREVAQKIQYATWSDDRPADM
jgi:hypothetical protein